MGRTTPKKRGKGQPTGKVQKVTAIDLFCGVGGLTHGLERAGIHVVCGVDIDPTCEYPYTANNDAEFLLKSVADLSASDVSLPDRNLKLLAGCAPCQPFSTYGQRVNHGDDRWRLLEHFGRLVKELQPDLVTMENVPNLRKEAVFETFVALLKKNDFHVTYEVVNCADFGVPQHRNRLVLLASKLGPISLARPTSKRKAKTVRHAIGNLPRIRAGQIWPTDALHQACELSPLNLARIRASKPGGTWREWDRKLVAKCHKKKSGKTYPGVYGRMVWDEPAPTMTTQYYGFGNGRFGHPEQNRAISIREGAILQSFPKAYKFAPKDAPIYRKTIGRHIGNAVPVKLGEAIGKSILAHIRSGRRPARRVKAT